MLVALIVFSIDSLILIYIALWAIEYGGDYRILIDFAFHGWVMFNLIVGTIAWAKLRRVNDNEYNACLKEVEEERKNY